jgi:hypothetical protein
LFLCTSLPANENVKADVNEMLGSKTTFFIMLIVLIFNYASRIQCGLFYA